MNTKSRRSFFSLRGFFLTFIGILLFLFISVPLIFFKNLIIPKVQGATTYYYVSPNGNDSNPGSQTQPWKTLQKASASLLPGDTVVLLTGIYTEKLNPIKSGESGNYITYTATPGTAIIEGSNIILNSAEGIEDGLVQIIGKKYIKIQGLTLRNSSVNCVNISSDNSGVKSSYIEISDLTIQNCKKVGIKVKRSQNILVKNNSIKHIDYSSGIGIWTSEDVIIDNNVIDTPHWYHECQGAYEEGLSIASANRFEVKNNSLNYTETPPAGYCSNSQRLGIDIKESSQNGSVHHNKVLNFDAAGIYVDGWHAGSSGTPTLNHINIFQNYVQDSGGIRLGCEQADGIVEYISVYNNIVVNSYFTGIEVRGAYGDGLRKNITIYNNLVYGANPKGGNGGAGISVTTMNLKSNNSDTPVIVRNNITQFYFLTTGGGSVGQIRSSNSDVAKLVTTDHNIVFGPQICSQEYPNCVELGSRTTENSTNLFINPSSFDFRLKATSPAINTGIAVSSVLTDYDGVARPQGSQYDIGPYKYRNESSLLPTLIPSLQPTNIPMLIPTVIPPTPTSVPLVTDFNHDGVVTILDYNLLVSSYGRTGIAGFVSEDMNKNGKVDIYDYSRMLEDLEKNR